MNMSSAFSDFSKCTAACENDAFFSVSQNTQVTEAWNKIAQSFKCTPIEGKCLIKSRCPVMEKAFRATMSDPYLDDFHPQISFLTLYRFANVIIRKMVIV